MRKIANILLWIPPLLIIAVVAAHAQSPTDRQTMLVANRLYENGRYEEAALVYEQLVAAGIADAGMADAGIADAAVYYNLGNAYFQQQEWGRAILSYRRASQLVPRDPAVRNNLILARSERVDSDTGSGGNAINLLATFSRSWISLNETALLALMAWVLFVTAVYTWRRSSGRRLQVVGQTLALLALLVLGASLLSLGSRAFTHRFSPEGVIIGEEVGVMGSLAVGESGEPDFYLHDGAEVLVTESRGTWLHVTLPGDVLRGWVPGEAVELIGLR